MILDTTLAYPKSKTLAEREVWNFIENLPEEERFDVVVINPGLILGPILSTYSIITTNNKQS